MSTRRNKWERTLRRRRIRYRPGNRRVLRCAYIALGCVAAAALLLSARVLLRSARTATLNRRLVTLHTVDGQAATVQVAAPPVGAGRVGTVVESASDALTLSTMGMPDGSPIVETAQPAGNTVFHKSGGDIQPDMRKLIKTNPDTIGWLRIAGVVDLPVVYRDNQYYLTHDFNGHHNSSGTLFLDQSHPFSARTQNLLIHGHSMFDGSMFGLLTHYQKLDSLRQHPLISFSTLYEKETYVVFAVLNVDPAAFDFYSHPTFASDSSFDAYIASVRAHSRFEIPVDVQPTDALLTLSTCIDDDRLVVLARRTRADETRDELICAVDQSRAVRS